MTTEPGALRDAPTVVVSRTLRPGAERAYERWRDRIAATAAAAPGFVQLDTPPVEADAPDERVIVYRFTSAGTLADWLASEARGAALARGQDLFLGEPREQVLAMHRMEEPVTAVASFHVRPGQQEAYREAFAVMRQTMSRFTGMLRCELLEPVEGVQEETVVLFAFATRAQLDAWLASTAREEALARMDPLIEGSRTLNVVGGYAGWFPAGGDTPVRRWKQAAVVLLALFPTALGLGLARQAVAPDMTLVPATFVGNVLGVAILTWVLMPWLTGLLDGWLRR